ncbi:MAG TPA: choice-of-anchor tandem repeat GloVer-containing protein [Candidatus Dormibacteraeota bacterium]|jgi:uncharacterized repeat protein (TIGR03803 family)|nr:choice-of-anchor tandem repeat GloVer-containing protein [Candidatus Dormibacteraeota bacterium]
MQSRKLSLGFLAAAIVAVTLLGAATRSAAQQKYTVLHSFYRSTDGAGPSPTVIFGAADNLFGTTYWGGTYSNGTVFELYPIGGGGWNEKVLHTFGGGKDGSNPSYGSLIFDAAGNLYGETFHGGTYGGGTAFELKPGPHGGWSEKVLHHFGSAKDGSNPVGGLIFDAAGNLYGTAQFGGTYGGGTAFELHPNANGGWTERVLHNFGSGTDGVQSAAGLIFDAAGNLYGTTWVGGAYGAGVVFELTPTAGGGWAEKVLHNFGSGTDGANAQARLIFDSASNLYSTTSFGGTSSSGTVFELTPNAGGSWTETVIHNFGNGTDGVFPISGSLIFDAAGNLYGTTSQGGLYDYGIFDGGGILFELTPNAGGAWTETVLHNFGNGTDGALPLSGVIFDAAGNIYGTASAGGPYGDNAGNVFEVRP